MKGKMNKKKEVDSTWKDVNLPNYWFPLSLCVSEFQPKGLDA